MTVSAILGALGVSRALGLNDIADEAIDTACEAIFDKKGKEVLAEVHSRLRAYTGSVPLNHDLEHAIRLSELTASLVLLGRYNRAVEVENIDNRSTLLSHYAFTEKMHQWLLNEIGLSTSMTLKSNDVIVSEINAGLDVVISETKVEVIEQELSSARDRVWSMMLTGAGPAPLEFKAMFFGHIEAEPGWSMLFVAFIREALKTNSRAEVAFITTRLSGARENLRRIEDSINLLRQETNAVKQDMSELMILIRQNAIIKQAGQEGVPEGLLRHATSLRYIDIKTREEIRSKFATYCHEYRVKLPTLAAKVEECLGSETGISVKTLRRFMRGIRVDDSFVELLINFADTLPAQSLPTIYPKGVEMKVELAVNERAEAIIFHNRPFAVRVDWFEFNIENSHLTIVLGGNIFRDFGIPIRPELARYLRRAHRVLMVQMDEETGQPIDGEYKPMLILTKEQDELFE